MRFYTNLHPYYCGIDLYARTLYVCILDDKGETLVHKEIKADPDAHNTLFDAEANILFGASSMYHMLPDAEQQLIRSIEERALNHFIADLLSVCCSEGIGSVEYQVLEQRSLSS